MYEHRIDAMLLSQVTDKIGSLGTIVSAMGCSMCFPAIASVGSALGLGFLASYEGLFINSLLPAFAVIALLANVIGGVWQRRWLHLLFGIAGPLMVLATLYLFWSDNWSTYLFYAGLLLMLSVSIWDFIFPQARACSAKRQVQKGGMKERLVCTRT
jgi:mercuric ion transport protein